MVWRTPVTLKTTSASLQASIKGITRHPFINASQALTGSTSQTITDAPIP